ncbi:ATP-binding cassette domain-containing protein [Algibacter amylolyticus]|uniref:ATP-binding cassette domain-containing protein n=1 Tax=Algibacter amylolyticus TaxID=1608400 RepID=A0A5M7B5B8_9FLAO|nr:ABC transporter ATP-binding protein [Algibacter amylolyticus]KAA5822451.1 ATP-binding cassette domain-containing protein [Algibacter amylolyticus]MBB5269174.1 lipopolysaccharide transport system ATP-binding protein [Algibacter amylolyticus]TSJ73601.1 ATP-binding cassette domain-containing protein [Algibacter amylolyticus]
MKNKDIILKVENISKQYRLGLVGTGTISHDLNRWWSKIRGKEDPYLRVGETNDRSSKGDSEYIWALKEINFEVQRGEVLGIIGKNGAGKSTLLKILSKVTGPTTGNIKTKGRIASLLEVGTGFHGEMTGRENIYLNGAILGMTKKEIAFKIDEIIEFSGCERYIDTPVKRYSSGMTVRLAFAVAAFLEPEILVIDEVLAVGDAEFQKKAIGKMQDISRGEGRTVLFVSHNMAAVKNLCTRAIVLEKGSSTFEGDVDACIEYYISNNTNKETNLSYLSYNEDKILQKIEINNKLIASGKDLKIRFQLNLKAINSTNIHLGVYNFNDEKILHLSSEYFNKGYISETSEILNCEIEKNPLTQGLYYVNVGVVSDKIEVERVKKCLVFEVLNSDFFNCGIILKPSTLKAKALAEYKWY